MKKSNEGNKKTYVYKESDRMLKIPKNFKKDTSNLPDPKKVKKVYGGK